MHSISLINLLTIVLSPTVSKGDPPIYETEHYLICSSATSEQTRTAACVAEGLCKSYTEFMREAGIKTISSDKHGLRIYRDRSEFKSKIPGITWEEAIYIKQNRCCHLYLDAGTPNPYHWMTHECTHQMSNEFSKFKLNTWLDEGLSTYFASSMIINGQPKIGTIDTNTYPAFHWRKIATSGNLEIDRKNGSIIPLATILTDNYSDSFKSNYNLYYLHWWTLTHFLLHAEDGKYRDRFFKLLVNGNDLNDFEKTIGSIKVIEPEWYSYIMKIKAALNTTNTPPVKIDPGALPEEFILSSG